MTSRKVLNLTREEQVDAFENAEKAARARLGEDATIGDVVQELAEAYTGHYSYDAETGTSALGIDGTASDDPLRTLEAPTPELDDVSAEELVEEMEAEEAVGGADEPPTSPPLLLRLTDRLTRVVR